MYRSWCCGYRNSFIEFCSEWMVLLSAFFLLSFCFLSADWLFLMMLLYPPPIPPAPFHPRRGGKGGLIWLLDSGYGVTEEASRRLLIAPHFERTGRSEWLSGCGGAARRFARARTKPFTTTATPADRRYLKRWRPFLGNPAVGARGQIRLPLSAPAGGGKGAGGDRGGQRGNGEKRTCPSGCQGQNGEQA